MLKNIITIFISIAICLITGFSAQYLQTDALINWYPFLEKSQITPPSYVFPIVWGILYILMGISIGLIIISKEIKKGSCVVLFFLQLCLNFLWSFFFFYLENPAYGTVIILLLDAVVIGYILKTYPIKKVSAYLFYPYLAWLFLATYLNLFIFINN